MPVYPHHFLSERTTAQGLTQVQPKRVTWGVLFTLPTVRYAVNGFQMLSLKFFKTNLNVSIGPVVTAYVQKAYDL